MYLTTSQYQRISHTYEYRYNKLIIDVIMVIEYNNSSSLDEKLLSGNDKPRSNQHYIKLEFNTKNP